MLKMRAFPIFLILIAAIFINVMSTVSGRSVLLAGLAEFAFTVFYFLILIAVFSEISLGESSTIRRIFVKIQGFLAEEDIYLGVRPGKFSQRVKTLFSEIFAKEKTQAQNGETNEKQEPDAEDESQLIQNKLTEDNEAASELSELIEIQKAKTQDQSDTGAEGENNRALMTVLFITSFAGISVWRLSRLFTVVPLSFTERYNYSIVNALLLLFLFCITVIYLKIRSGANNESSQGTSKRPGDKVSGGMLTLLAYVSLVYAVIIAAHVVLNINILPLLQWLFYAASIYLITALAVNILLGIFKKNITSNFDYTIIPQVQKTGGTSSFLDSEDVKLNFSLKSLYTFKYTLKIFPGIILSLGLILLLSTTIFIVQPHQQAAVFRFGKLERSSIMGEGLHFKLPWPIDIVKIHDVHRINSLQIGYEAADRIHFLWADALDGSGLLLLLGNGNEAVAVNLKIVYKISDLYYYIKTSSNPEAELRAAAYRALMNRTINTTLDAFLSVDRSLLSASILDELSAFSEMQRLGLSVVQVIIENIHPPVEVADVYQRVATAFIDKNTIITDAHAEAERLLIHAQRQSSVAIEGAIADQYNRVSAAMKEMAIFYEAMDAYELNPRSFRLTRSLTAFESAVAGNKVFVFSPGTEDNISSLAVGGQASTIFNPGFQR